MANKVYPTRGPAYRGELNLLTADIKAVALDATFVPGGEMFLSDIPTGAVVDTSANLTGKTVSDAGVFNADSASFDTEVDDEIAAVAVFVDTGSPATSRLLVYMDEGEHGPINVIPNGSAVNVIWPSEGICVL